MWLSFLYGMRRKALAGLLSTLVVLSPCVGAEESPSRQDVQVIGRVLKFQEDRKGDALRVAIAYDPANPASSREAAMLAQFIGSGQAVGSLTLSGVLVEQGRVGALAGYDAIFAAGGTDPGQIGRAIRQHMVPCITREVELVSDGACIVAIQTAPNTAIYFSSSNAAAAGVHFATAFIMMVREL